MPITAQDFDPKPYALRSRHGQPYGRLIINPAQVSEFAVRAGRQDL
jgi:hypothetical protein